MRVLLVRAGALGDVLLLRPTIFGLQNAGHTVALMAPSGAAAALVGGGMGEVPELVAWERADVAALLHADAELSGELLGWLRGFDLAVVLSGDETLRSRLRAAVIEVRARHPLPPPSTHAAEWALESVRDLTSVTLDVPPIVPTPAEASAAAPLLRELPNSFLAVHPGSGSARKNWPTNRFAAVVEALAPGQPFLLVEGPADASPCAPLRRLPLAVLAHGLPVRVLGAALSRAGVLVANDSGVAHLAAAWGAPTVALFGPTSAAVWRPVGPSVVTVSSRDETMEGVPLADVRSWAEAIRR